MSFLIEGTEIKRPTSMKVTRVSQYAQQKTLDGSVSRDYMGDDKYVFELNYENLNATDFSLITAIYDDYKVLGPRYFDTTGEAALYGTLVHVELGDREFASGGNQYLANFTLILTEA